MPECIFCQIAKGKIPCFKVYEDDRFLAFLDINPANEGHTLVIPKKHYENIYQMDAVDTAALFAVVNGVAKALNKTLDIKGLNILQNNGEIAGQRMPHVYVHLIPRYEDDEVIIQHYKPKEIDKDKIAELAKNISGKIAIKREKSKEKPKRPKVPKGKKSEIEKKKIHYEEWL